MDFDKILQQIGGWNRYQIYTYIIIGIAATFSGIHNLAAIFTAGLPDSICNVPGAPSDVSPEAIQSRSAPLKTLSDGTTKFDLCTIYGLNYSSITDWDGGNSTFNHSGIPLVTCEKWDYDKTVFETSVVSRWDLVCNQAWKRAASRSIFMFGFMVGCIGFGALSDRIGRKLSLLMSVILLVLSGTAAAFAPEYWSYVGLRCVSAMGSAGVFTSGFVITMELIDLQHRLLPGLLYQGWFAIGYMILSGIAYFVRDYVQLQLIISVPPILVLSYYWLIDESPRWLISQGRYKEAEKIIRKIAKMNRKPVPEELLKVTEQKIPEEEEEEKKYTIVDLLRQPRMRKRAINTFFNWMVNSLVYYGLSFGVSDLDGSTHFNLVISGLVEFPGYALSMLLSARIGRRWALASIMVFGGVACACMLPVPKYMVAASITLSMLGKMAISGSYAVIYVFSAELFPTVIRQTAVGAGSMHARIGGILAPFIAELRHLAWEPLPTIIFAATSIVAGLLALLLPETLHQKLPETIEDGELFGLKQYKVDDRKTSKNGEPERLMLNDAVST